MKKTLLTFAIAIYSLANTFAQIPNPGFESWKNNALLIPDPEGWITLNSFSFLGIPPTAEKSADAKSGSSSLKLSVKEFIPTFDTEKDTIAGLCITGLLNSLSEGDGSPGFPYTSRPTSFSGYYKYLISKPDQGGIAVGFSKWNPRTNEADSIGGTLFIFDKNVTNWTPFTAPIFWTDNRTMPDTAVIYIIASTSERPIPGTTLLIDDLSLMGGSVAVESGLSPLKTSAYPNPAKDELNISNIDPQASNIQVVDMAGKLVESINFQPSETLRLSTMNYNNGMYLFEIKDADLKTLQRARFTVSK